MSFFGKKELNLIDYEKPKTNPFLEYKRTLEGYVPDSTMLVPLQNWFSNHPNNVKKVQFINDHFFFVSKDILARTLTLNIDRRIKFIKYPKKPVNEIDEELAWLIPYICKYYSWSEREFQLHQELIDLTDEELHQALHKRFGFDKKECRKLGIKNEKIVAKYDGRKIQGFFA